MKRILLISLALCLASPAQPGILVFKKHSTAVGGGGGALTRAGVGSYDSLVNHGTGAYTTAAFTPPNNSLLVVGAMQQEPSGAAEHSASMTISDSAGLTWTARANVGGVDFDPYGLRVWTAPVTTGVSMTVSVDCDIYDIKKWLVHIVAYTNYDVSSPVGQTKTNSAVGTNGVGTITLDGAPASTSEVLAYLAKSPSAGVFTSLEGSGWTELYDTGESAVAYMESQVRGGSVSTSVTWQDINDGAGTVASSVGAAIEVKQTP